MEQAPVSRRTLAQWAGVSHSTLNRIANMEVERVDPEVATRVAIALVKMAEQMRAGALGIREFLPEDASEWEDSDGQE